MNPNETIQIQNSQQNPVTSLDTLENVEKFQTGPTMSSLYIAQQDNSQAVNKVIATYLKLNKLFFGIGIYIIIGLLIGGIVRSVSLPSNSLPFPIRNEQVVTQESMLKNRILGMSDGEMNSNDLFVIVKQGDLKIDTTNLRSINNLITYKGFTLPQKTLLDLSVASGSLPKSSYFVSGGYSITDIDSYLKNIIYDNYISSPNFNPVLQRSQLLNTTYSFVDYFGIQCLLYPGFGINVACDNALKLSLPNLSIYNLAAHYEDVKTIAKKVQKTKNQDSFCSALQQYIFISNDISSSMKDIFSYCGEKYEAMFSEFSSFRTIQDQLSKQSILPNVTNSAVLNSYKLVSIMQEIYHEVMRGNNVNELRIGSYADYVESLLKNTQYLQGFYMDIIGRYNNSFLVPMLTQRSLTARGEVAAEYRKLLIKINELNEGSIVKGFTGLNKLVTQQDILLSSGNISYTGDVIQTGTTSLVEQFQKNYLFSNYILIDVKENAKDSVLVSGRLRFEQVAGLANNTPLNVVFVYKDQRFYAQSIDMPRQPLLALLINQKLILQPLLINELYDLIIQTQKVATLPTSKSVCDAFSKTDGMTSCTNDTIQFTKDNKISYSFQYTQSGLLSYSISPKELDTQVRSTYGETVTITKDPIEAIKIVLNYIWNEKIGTGSDTDTSSVGGVQEVQLQKNFDEIGATIEKISKSENYFIVDFALKSYKFTSLYDPSTQSIIGMGIVVGKANNTIRNFKFSFLTSSVSDKNLLKNDPKTFLLQFDPLTVKRLQL